MGNGSRRRRMDPEKARVKRAEWARMAQLRAKRDRQERNQREENRQLEPYQRMVDPRTPPAEAAELVWQVVADKPALAAGMVQVVTLWGGSAEHLTEVSRLALSGDFANAAPKPGVFAFAAQVAHAVGDKEALRRYTEEVHRHAAEAEDKKQWLNAISVTDRLRPPGESADTSGTRN